MPLCSTDANHKHSPYPLTLAMRRHPPEILDGNPNANPPRQETHHEDDEALWDDFVHDFEQAFADTASAERTYADLTRLGMKGDEIDEYIATFEHLLTKPGWERTAHGSLETFKTRLEKGLALDHSAKRPDSANVRRLADCRVPQNPGVDS